MAEGTTPAAASGFIRYLLIATIACGIIVPLIYAYLGTHSRYLLDDLCRASHLQDMSIWRHQTYLYNNEQGRFSFSFLISVAQSLGPWTARVMPVLMISLWLGAFTWTLRQLGRLALEVDSWLAAGALATVCVFASLAVLPDRLDALYWLTGNLTYMIAPALFVVVAGLLALVWLDEVSLRVAGPVAAVLCFLAAGFSETFDSWQLTALLISLAGLAAVNGERRRRLAPVLAAALTGSLLATAIVYASPGVDLRREALPDYPSLGGLVSSTSSATRVFVVDGVAGGMPLLAGIVTFLLVLATNRARRLSAGDYAFWVLITLLAGLLLVAATIAPGYYALGQEPPPRVLTTAALSLTATLVVLGYLTAALVPEFRLSARLPSHAPLIAVALLVAIFAVPTAASGLGDRDLYEAWARDYDARDATLRQPRARGTAPLVVRNVGPEILRTDPAHWINQCFADYYDIQEGVTASPQ